MSDITDIVSRLRRTDENRGVAICSEAADTIEQLRKERDEARREILESLHPDLRKSYAAAREWDIPEYRVTVTQYWCDDCGDAIEKGNEFFYAELPCDIASANKGESATICRKCNKRIEAEYYNKKEKENDSE